jgi:two-component system response regulator NreC
MTIKLVIVEDHQIVRDGLKVLLGIDPSFEIVGEASDSDELYSVLSTIKPDVILLDISLPGKPGTVISAELKNLHHDIKVIILTADISEKNIRECINAGVRGFLPKNSGKDVLFEAVKTVYRGETYFDDSVSRIFLNNYVQQTGHDCPKELTQRETEIVKLLTEGLSHKEIGSKLFISKRTVDSHVSNIMEKLGFSTKAEIIRYTIINRIIDL